MNTRIRATGICITDDQKILLLKEEVQGRPYALPGGGVEPGETIAEALVREFKEELNLAISVENKIVYMSEYNRADAVHVVEVAMLVTADEEITAENALLVPLSKAGDYIRQTDVVAAIQNAPTSFGRYLGVREA